MVGDFRLEDFVLPAWTVDAVVVVDVAGAGPQVTCDLAIEQYSLPEPVALAGLRFGTPEHQQALRQLVDSQTKTRNREDGWWVASNDPEAASRALTGSYPLESVQRMAAFTDGATRPVDQMNLYDWSAYLDLLDKVGAQNLIAHVRRIESDDRLATASLVPSDTTTPPSCSSFPSHSRCSACPIGVSSTS